MQKLNKLWQLARRQPRWRWWALVLLLGGVGLLLWNRSVQPAGKLPTFAARRGPLEITVLEGGNLQALESQEIKCEVRVGYQGTKILKIVEEGYQVTEADVKTNKVLVELDSSDLQKQIVQQEIQYQSAVASLIDAQQNYEIQLSQNASDVKDAEQKVRFARMDFDKFLGESVTASIVRELGLDRLLAAASTNDLEQAARTQAALDEKPAMLATNSLSRLAPVVNCPPGTAAGGSLSNGPAVATGANLGGDPPDSAEPAVTNIVQVDFSKYARLDALGDGEARQKLRKFEDDYQVAQKELGQAKSTLEGTQRLFEKGFVTKTDLARDEIAHENSRLKVVTAESARALFLEYDFLKSAEESLSKYADAVRELDRARHVAISKRAQAKAKLKSAQGQYQVQLRQRSDLNEQLEKCILRAQKPGLVVYGSAGDENIFYGGEERIREGATVRERQAIITIPDLTRMAVKVKIHESYIQKIKKGQKVRITVDAFPEKVLTGEVTKVGVLPDSQNRWLSPDLKVYLTTIVIDGTQDWVKPGMTAKVEILVNKLEDCLYVPMQAVVPETDKQICYVAHGFKPERREVTVGEFNDEFIEVKGGLKEGESVLLRPPEGSEPAKPNKPITPAPAVAVAPGKKG